MLLKVAWRSLWRNRRRTIITVTSIALSLTIAVFFIALANGMYAKMIEQAVRMQAGHLTVEHRAYRDAPAIDLLVDDSDALAGRIGALEAVESTKPLVLGQGVAKSGRDSIGVAIVGVLPSVEARASPLVSKVIEGDYLADGDERSVVVGRDLAERLGVRLGKKLVLTSNDASGQLVEELVRVKGIFQTNVDELDGYFVQIPLGFARKLFGLGPQQVTQLGVVLADPAAEAEVGREVAGLLAGTSAVVLSWREVLPDLAAYIQLDGGSNYVFQGIILFLIMFTIFNTILMSALERKREFAVLLALGTPPARLKLQLLVEAGLLAAVGCFFGLGVGAGLTAWAEIQGIDVRSLYESGVTVSGVAVDFILRPHLTLELLLVLGGVVFAATLLMSLAPMGRIKRIPVADVLR